LKEQAAAQGGGESDKESDPPFDPGDTLFGQFLKRFFRRPFQFRNPAEKVMALGSGFIIDPAGYIVTNNHVVANQGSVTVIIQDKAGITAKVIGRDEKTGTVLLEIDTDKKLPYATWGDSDDRAGRRLGLSLSANPFGLDGSVTRHSAETWG